MAEDWQVQGVEDALRRAHDVGETRTGEALQAEVGIGAGDLQAALEGARDRGRVQQVATNEYEWVGEELADERAALAAIEEPEDDGEPVALRGARGAEARRIAATLSVEEETVLTRAMVESLGDEPLGALVKAGLAGANGEFVLRVRA